MACLGLRELFDTRLSRKNADLRGRHYTPCGEH
jgi:hypothetical protein